MLVSDSMRTGSPHKQYVEKLKNKEIYWSIKNFYYLLIFLISNLNKDLSYLSHILNNIYNSSI